MGCTAISVKPVPSTIAIDRVYIRTNPKVLVSDFVDVLRDGFARHGIASEVIAEDAHAEGKYVVTYTALRSWDLAPYLSVAEIGIEKDGYPVASAHYHLRGKGGYDLGKYRGTKAKMDPVIDQLLSGIYVRAKQPPGSVMPTADAPGAPPSGAAGR
jgi:hypothetical protein